MVLTDAKDSEDADAALGVPGKETDDAALGTGERGVALPKAFSNADLIATPAKDPDCLHDMQLVNKPRAQWPPHLAAAPLQFLYVAGVLCVHIDDVVRPEPRPERRDNRTESPTQACSTLSWPSPHRATRGLPAASYTCASPQLLRGTILGWPRHSHDWHCGIGGRGSAPTFARF